MTTFEHAMLGANGVVACGLQRRYGWRLVALAGVAAVAPDWDGLTVLFDASVFDQGHRVWGHNVFACCLIGVFISMLDLRFNLTGRLVAWLRTFRMVQQATTEDASGASTVTPGFVVFAAVAVVAALSQIPADAVVSGGHGLEDWPVQYLWPVADAEIVYPLVPWGDPGITIVFCIGMIAAARFGKRLQLIAASTLMGVAGYIAVRGLMFG